MLDRDRLVNNICSEANCTIIDDRSWLHSVVQPGFLFAGGGGGLQFHKRSSFRADKQKQGLETCSPPPPTHTHSIYATYCIMKPTFDKYSFWVKRPKLTIKKKKKKKKKTSQPQFTLVTYMYGGGLGAEWPPFQARFVFVLLCFVLFWGLAIQKEAMGILCPLDCTFFQSFCSLHHCKRPITDIVKYKKITLLYVLYNAVQMDQ